MWSNLRSLDINNSVPWIVAGDFNVFLTRDEKKGGSNRGFVPYRKFNELLRECSMFDLGFYGPKFTWHQGLVFERIDRAVGNEAWKDVFPDTHVFHRPKVCSDHRPILIQTWSSFCETTYVRQFRFMAPWISHTSWDSFIRNNWDQNLPFGEAITKLIEKVVVWNKEVFGNIFQRKRKILARLGVFRKLLKHTLLVDYEH